MIDREALLDELARCFVQAAVSRLLRERRGVDNGAGGELGHAHPTQQDRCESPEQPNDSNASPAPISDAPSTQA